MSSDVIALLATISQIKLQLAQMESVLSSASTVVENAVASTIPSKRGRPSKKAAAEATAEAATADVVTAPGVKKEMSLGMKQWHEFNARLDTLFKEKMMQFKRVAESKKFASKLKNIKPFADWEDEQIISERKIWNEEQASIVSATDSPAAPAAVVAEVIDTTSLVIKKPKVEKTDAQKAQAKALSAAKKAAKAAKETKVPSANASPKNTTPIKEKGE